MSIRLIRTIRAAFASCVVALMGWGGTASASEAAHDLCPRPAPGSVVEEPEDLRSQDGVLKVDLAVRNERQKDGSTRYCYLIGDGSQAPTLRLKPGDLLVLRLKNRLSDRELSASARKAEHSHHNRSTAAADPCTSSAMTPTSTNLHFHGLSVPSVCHQ